MINDILDFSKMEAGRLDLEPSVFDLADTVNDVIGVLASRADEKGLSLAAEMGEGLPDYVQADPIRIQQILLNLAGNAVKFTDAGGVVIRAGVSGRTGQTIKIRFEVEDSGIGIEREDHAKLFDDFWVKAQHLAGGASSTGLGLAISKRLVEMMSGSIGFESEKGRGSTFWFELPLALPSAEAIVLQQRQRAPCKAASAVDADVRLSGRVLVGEDNPTNQLIVRAMLERLGLQVEVVADGHKVVEAVAARPYDLVLMDIGMPEMDGLEATAAVRALPAPGV